MADRVDYLSVCSGIEAASVAWAPLNWRPVGFSEIEPFPRAVLAHRHPDVPLHGDFTQLVDDPPACDLLVGGTPCQSFSIAGCRHSLDDDRGNLTLQFVRLLDAIDKARAARGQGQALASWENVPGVLSTKDNAFGCFLGALVGEPEPLRPAGKKWTHAGLVVGPTRAVAWRILDAQYFGLAQRRQRVFALIGPRDWPVASALFPVEEGVRRDTPPSRKKGESAAGTLAASLGQRGGTPDVGGACNGQLVPAIAATLAFGGNNRSGPIDVAPALSAHPGACGRMDFTVETFCLTGPVTHTLRAEGHDAMEDGTGRGTPIVPVAYPLLEVGARTGVSTTDVRAGTGIGAADDPMFTLQASKQHGVAYRLHSINSNAMRAGGDMPYASPADVARALDTKGGFSAAQGGNLIGGTAVRRLTPRECERLQGFPDDYTLVPYRKGNAAKDGPRYKALGNSMAVPCMRWLGRRIEAVQSSGLA